MSDTGVRHFEELSEEPDRFVRELKDSGQPVVVDIHGQEVIVQDAAAYNLLLDELDRAEAIAGIRRGLEDMYAGRTKPLDQAFARIRRSK